VRSTSLVILCILLFNQCLAAISNAQQFSSVANKLDDNTLVICTGAEVKFISSFDYFEFGKIVEVAPSVDADLSVKCPIETGIPVSDVHHNSLEVVHQSRASLHLERSDLKEAPFISKPYSYAITRAPPIIYS